MKVFVWFVVLQGGSYIELMSTGKISYQCWSIYLRSCWIGTESAWTDAMSGGTSHSVTLWRDCLWLDSSLRLNIPHFYCAVFVFSVVSSQSHDSHLIMGNTVKGRMGCEATKLQLQICLQLYRVGTLQYWIKLTENTLFGEGGKDWWTEDNEFLHVVSGGRQWSRFRAEKVKELFPFMSLQRRHK